MGLSREEVLHIAWLARLNLSPEEIERFKEQLSHILDHFQVLQEVDTSQVPPTAYPITLQNVFREDEVSPSFPQQEVLSNAPSQEEGCFKVRLILEE
jgi:aspartyl-tRNA(Asn)/glutamyl-tRNA(Gln) amidotransferase subunit C